MDNINNAVIAFILRFYPPNSTDFQADYITVVEDRSTCIMSVTYCLAVPVFYFWRKLYCTLQRGLSAIAEPLVHVTLDTVDTTRLGNVIIVLLIIYTNNRSATVSVNDYYHLIT